MNVATCVTTLAPTELDAARGGAFVDDNRAFGRCGPGTSWRWLGNVYTPECLAHDTAVRASRQAGASYLRAQVEALPELPAAIGSYVKARWQGRWDDRAAK